LSPLSVLPSIANAAGSLGLGAAAMVLVGVVVAVVVAVLAVSPCAVASPCSFCSLASRPAANDDSLGLLGPDDPQPVSTEDTIDARSASTANLQPTRSVRAAGRVANVVPPLS